MIAASDLAKAYGAQTLFEDVTFQLNAGCRYGLVGSNGSGKTTLLRILAGQEEASAGAVARPKRLRLGVLEQDQFQHDEMPIIDVVMMGHRELWAAMRAKDELLSEADRSFDADRYAELEDVIVSQDGYAFEARAGGDPRRAGHPHRGPPPAPGHSLRRFQAAGALGQGAGRPPAAPAPGRAHQPPGHRLHPLAGEVPGRPSPAAQW